MSTVTPGVDELARQADALLEAKRLPEAKALYERITTLAPDHADAWFMLGLIHGDMGQADTGIRCLQKSLKLDPESADTHLNLGNLLFQRGQSDAAIEHLQRAVTLDSEYPEAWMLQGSVFGQLGGQLFIHPQYHLLAIAIICLATQNKANLHLPVTRIF